MFLLLSKEIQCFSQNSTLTGNLQESQLIMTLYPVENQSLHCVSFNNSLSKAILHYEEGGSVKEVNTEYQYYNDQTSLVLFKIADKPTFEILTKLSIISYTVVLDGKLPVNGTFQKIQHTLINTSNCWSDVTLVYNRSANSFLEITATPNDCLITTPKVTFQYQIGQDWIPIQIEPNASSPAGGYKLPFVHMDTTSYQIFSETSPELEKQINTFFDEFAKNRQIPIRLELKFTRTGSMISQQIYTHVESIKSYSTECITKMKLNSIITAESIWNVGQLNRLSECEKSKYMSTVSVFNGQQIVFDDITNSISGTTALAFFFDERNPQILSKNISNIHQQLYLTFMDDDMKIIFEETQVFDPIQSCFFDIKTQIKSTQTCFIVFPTLTEKCLRTYKNGIKTRFQQILQMNLSSLSRISYQVYETTLTIKNQSFYKKCLDYSSIINESLYPFYQGSYKTRQNAYIKNIKMANNPTIFITNVEDYQYQAEISISDVNTILLYFFIIIGVVLAVVITVTIISILKLQ